MFIRVHPRPIGSFAFKAFANIKSVFICVHLCPDKKFSGRGSVFSVSSVAKKKPWASESAHGFSGNR